MCISPAKRDDMRARARQLKLAGPTWPAMDVKAKN